MTLIFGILSTAMLANDDVARRQEYLEQLQRVLPACKPWGEWLERTGELPPDFAGMAEQALLPNPLGPWEGSDKNKISDATAWEGRRELIKRQLMKWAIGTVPPPPEDLSAEIIEERREEGALVRRVKLRFGPGQKANLRIELLIPTQGEGPFPVFMTQHNHRAWALIALSRGYLCCVYAGSDSCDDTDSFMDAYPDHDWSRLTRRAWAAGRCIDYLSTLPESNIDHIALTGHSRNGKQSLIAAALDERIKAVISSSSGQGGSLTTRLYSEQHFGEGIENITRAFPDWFHPRLRFFVGREHKLPVDFHCLVALCAPRPCLLSSALNDGCGSAWAQEQTYLAVKPVYELFGAHDKLRIMWRSGGHETCPETIERYLDWCDKHFGINDFDFPETLFYPHDWDKWRSRTNGKMNPSDYEPGGLDGMLLSENSGGKVENIESWERRKKEIVENTRLMLGSAPPVALNPGGTYGEDPQHVESLLRRDSAGPGLEKDECVFGEYMNADVYMPEGTMDSERKLPGIIWLHPFSYPKGYAAAYRRGEQAYRAMARAGFAVFCFDQIGFGRRISEVGNFYERYPDWSLLGKMVRDTRAALDVVTRSSYVDNDHIYLVGFGLGALVGLHTMALDDRPAGLAAVCGPPPFRLDKSRAKTGGIARWSRLHMLIPKLGFFMGQEESIPYDIHELMACAAPRPLLVVAPELDREAPPDRVSQAVDAARKVYDLVDAEQNLELAIPEDYRRFGPEMQTIVVRWLRRMFNRS